MLRKFPRLSPLILAVVLVVALVGLIAAAAGCSTLRKNTTTGEVVSKGVQAAAGAALAAGSGNFTGAAKSVYDYFAWLIAAATTPAAVVAGVKLRTATRPWDRTTERRAEKRRRPPPPPTDPAPPAAPSIPVPIDPESSAASIVTAPDGSRLFLAPPVPSAAPFMRAAA